MHIDPTRNDPLRGVPRIRASTARLSAALLILGASSSLSCGARAQAAGGAATSLPAIEVDAPKEQKKRLPAVRKPVRTPVAAAARPRPTRRQPTEAAPQPTPVAGSATAEASRAAAAAAAGPPAFNPQPLQQSPQAGKTGTKLADVPGSIQIVQGNLVREQGGTNLDAAIRNVSGVSQGGGDGFGFAERFLIRGLNPQIYSDDFSEGDQRNGIQQSINGVDHIEVIKGPGSAILGSGPPGGSINIVHLQPLPILASGASVQYGTFNTVTTNLYVTGPTTVAPGLNFRIDGQVQHTDGFRGLKKGDYEFRPELSWDLNGHLLTLSVDARHLTAIPDPSGIVYFKGQPAPVSRDTKYSTPFGNVSQDYVRTSATDTWSATDYLTVSNRFSYMHRTSDILRNGDGSATVGVSETGRQLRSQNDRLDDFDYQFEPLWRFNTAGIGHTLLTGFEARHQSLYDVRATADLPNIGNIFAPVITDPVSGLNFLQNATHSGFADEVRATYVSAYAVDQIDATDRLKLRFSGRYDHFDTGLTPEVFVPGRIYQGTQLFQPGVTYKEIDDPLSWSAGVLYKILPGVSPYVGASRSNFANFSSEATSAAVHAPESAMQLEAGLKIDAFNERLALTFARFDVRRNNVFVLVGDNVIFNNQRTSGFEVDAQAFITPEWKILANATLQGANLTSNPSAPTATGNQPIGVPLHIANLFTSYDFAVGGLHGFTIAGGASYRDKIFADQFNTTSVPAYTIFDAILSFNRPNYGLSVGVKNITDKLYFVNANSAGAFVGEPRTIFAKLKVQL